MNVQEIQGQWNKVRGRVKEKWGQLSDDDLTMKSGNLDQVVGRIQQKTGEGREAIERFIDEVMGRGAAGVSHVAEAAREYASQAGAYLHEQSNRLRDRYGDLSDGARQRVERAEDLVRHNPAQSVAAAFGVGIVVGVVVGLALRSRY